MKNNTDNRSDYGIIYTENVTCEKESNTSIVSDCFINQIKDAVVIQEQVIYLEKHYTIKY
ncbi:MAG TPA: hypothetical protein VJ861_09445 [Treponemataceae bacterium]|nr:hypothetical protein [Treponemataceae bacterium]